MGTKGKVISVIAIVLMMALLSFAGVWAMKEGNVQVGGTVSYTAPLIYSYNETDSTASVIGYSSSFDIASLEIPSSTKKDGKTYTVTSIGDGAFQSCSILASVTIPDGVTIIGGGAFVGCSNLTSVTLPASVTSIGDYAFDMCGSLTSMNYLGTLKDWVGISFGSYSNPTLYTRSLVIGGKTITSITAEDLQGVTSIGRYAFYNCSNLTSITLPASVTSIGLDAFMGCGGLTSMNYLGTIKKWVSIDFQGGTSNPTFYTAKLVIQGKEITSISAADLEGVTSIPFGAFDNCQSLKSITIPETVTSIGQYAFSNCIGLQSVYIDSATVAQGLTERTSMGNLIYYATTVYVKTGFEVGAGITSTFPYSYDIVGGDFAGYTKYTKTEEIPDASEVLIFSYNEENSTASVIGNGITTANYNLTIPSTTTKGGKTYTVTSIGSNAFSSCTNLASVTIPDGVTIIGVAFAGCSNLTSITLPASVISIGEYAFDMCGSLTSMNYLGTLKDWVGIHFGGRYGANPTYYTESLVINGKTITSVSAQDLQGATSIGQYAFINCKNLTSVELPTTVTTIGDYAFYDCTNLASVTIPESVTSIGDGAFAGCSSLATVVIDSGTVSSGLTTKSSMGNLIYYATTVYVKTGLPVGAGITSIFPYSRDIAGGEFAGYTKYTKTEAIPDSSEVLIYSYDEENLTASIIGHAITDQNYNLIIPSTTTKGGKTYTVTSIADVGTWPYGGLFYNCTNLASVTIPASITYIGIYAFSSCTNLTDMNYLGTLKDWVNIKFAADASNPTRYTESLVIQGQPITQITAEDLQGVTSIGAFAFQTCTSLTSIEIPASVTSIGDGAFKSCTNLASVTIPSLVTSIGSDAFYRCLSLLEVEIPAGVTIIEEYTFYHCESLAKLTLPEGVTKIGSSAFGGCGLTSITIPYSVKIIEDHAFNSCEKLTNVEFPEGLESIGTYAFRDCEKLTQITIPSLVTSIESDAFYGCSSLTTVIIESSAVSSGLTTKSSMGGLIYYATAVYVKTGLTVGAGITGNFPYSRDIAGGEFEGYTKYTKTVDIPDAEEYPYLTFEYTTDVFDMSYATIVGNTIATENFNLVIPIAVFKEGTLYTVRIADGSESGTGVFYGNTYIKSVEIPEDVSGGDYAFEGCTNLESVVVDYIGYREFYNCKNLSSVTIGSRVKSLGSAAFGNCSNLKNMNYLGTLKDWVGISFEDTNSNPTYYTKSLVIQGKTITSVSAQDLQGATRIGSYAFYYCENLTSVEIPSTVTSIGDWAFDGCSSLASVTIPESVTSIGKYAFRKTSIQSVTIPSQVMTINIYTFANCKNLSTVTIQPGCLQTIDNSAFRECSNLASINIPSTVTSIGQYAFYNCSNLTSITIPSSVASIGSSAFNGCKTLTTVKIDSATISSGLTKNTSMGRLIYYANQVWVKTGNTAGAGITSNFPVIGTTIDDKYVTYSKNQVSV